MQLRMVLFFAIMTTIVVGLHTYVGWRVIRALEPGRRGRAFLRVLLVASSSSILLAFFVGRILEPSWVTRTLNRVGFTALGVIAILFALFLIRDALLLPVVAWKRGALVRRASDGGELSTRRDVLSRASGLAALGTGGLLAGGSIIQAHRDPVVEHVRIPFEMLPRDLHGFRIAQISDLHLGPMLGADFSESIVRRVNALDADVVAVTGDLVDGRVSQLAGHVAPLAGLRGRHGVFFVTGNHEYYWDAPAWTAHLRGLGWHVLENAHRLLHVGEAVLALGGVTDAQAASFDASKASDPVRAMAGAEAADFRLLLAHQPKSLYGAKRADVDLQLSGHTHAGQVFPMSLLVYLAHPIVKGLGRFGRTWVYVNRGTATWGPPMRTGRPGEITLVELESVGPRV